MGSAPNALSIGSPVMRGLLSGLICVYPVKWLQMSIILETRIEFFAGGKLASSHVPEAKICRADLI